MPASAEVEMDLICSSDGLTPVSIYSGRCALKDQYLIDMKKCVHPFTLRVNQKGISPYNIYTFLSMTRRTKKMLIRGFFFI